MNQLLKNVLLLAFGFSLSFMHACSTNNENVDGQDDIQLVSTNPEENALISTSTESFSFVFNQAIYVADKAKIMLNGTAVSNVSVYGTSLSVKINSLASGTDYTLIIDKGADRKSVV